MKIGSHKRPLAGTFAGGLVLIAISSPAVWAEDESNHAAAVIATTTPSERVRHPREKTYMKRQWGVEIVYVRQAASGYMLEFRYKVLDPEKAQALFERRTKPVLVHLETGARLIVPTPAKTGALRNSNLPLAGRTYWMFFANPGKLVQMGDHVNVEIGEFLTGELVVQ